MDNLFSGLDDLGINISSIQQIFEKDETTAIGNKIEPTNKTPDFNEVDYIFEKTMTCPVCNKTFKTKVVKTGKPRLKGTDTDLKPIFFNIEPLKYEIITCMHCGYSAPNRTFGHLTPGQIKLVREAIGRDFKGWMPKGNTYTFNEAIERYKLALATTVVSKGKVSERAYICLKLAWVFRSMALDPGKEDHMLIKLKDECIAEEAKYIKVAYEGFSTAYTKETPPICGMDIDTFTYLLADLARRNKDYLPCKRYIASLLQSRMTSEKLKNKARELKELVLAEETNEANKEN